MRGSISVFIPCFNSASFIRDSLDSVRRQTRPALEIIVVDDASGDETIATIRDEYPEVHILESVTTRGQGASRNRGVAETTGDYVALLDHDDSWRSDHLDILGGLLDQYAEVPLVFSRLRLIGSATGSWPHEGAELSGKPADLLVALLRNNLVMPSGMLFRRGLWDEAGPFDETEPFGVDDYRFVLEAAARHPIIGCSTPTADYRCHDAQASRNRGPQVVRAFEHRQAVVSKYRDALVRRGQLRDAEAAILNCWEEHLETAWTARDMKCLRQMIKSASQSSDFSRAARSYRWKAVLPSRIMHMIDLLRDAGRSFHDEGRGCGPSI